MSQSSPTCTRGLHMLCISPSLAVGTPLCGQRARLQEGTAVSCKLRSLQHQGLPSGKVMWVPYAGTGRWQGGLRQSSGLWRVHRSPAFTIGTIGELPAWGLTLRRGSEWPGLPHRLCLEILNEGQVPTCPQATGPCPLPIPLCTGRQGGLPERGSEPSSPMWPLATAQVPWPQYPQLCRGDGHSCIGAQGPGGRGGWEGDGQCQAGRWAPGMKQALAPVPSQLQGTGQAVPPCPLAPGGRKLHLGGAALGRGRCHPPCQVPPTGCSPQRSPWGLSPVPPPAPHRRSKPCRAQLWPPSRQL